MADVSPFDREPSEKIIVNPRENTFVADENLIPPGLEPKVFEMETGLGMSEPWPARFTQDEPV